MKHTWDKYFDTTSECWTKLQALYAANEYFPKAVVKGRNLHHKFLRSWSKKEKEVQDDDADNLVSLSEGDHFLAHFYIWKSAKKGYRVQAALAVRMMYRKSLKYITAEIAEDIAKVWEHKEYTHAEETKRKMSAAKKGKKGHKHSEETKKKISIANKGNKIGPMSEEQKQKISNSLNGHEVSEEAKQKISDALRGYKFSEEHKRKLSESRSKLGWKIDTETGKRVYYKMEELNS